MCSSASFLVKHPVVNVHFILSAKIEATKRSAFDSKYNVCMCYVYRQCAWKWCQLTIAKTWNNVIMKVQTIRSLQISIIFIQNKTTRATNMIRSWIKSQWAVETLHFTSFDHWILLLLSTNVNQFGICSTDIIMMRKFLMKLCCWKAINQLFFFIIPKRETIDYSSDFM